VETQTIKNEEKKAKESIIEPEYEDESIDKMIEFKPDDLIIPVK